MLNTFQLVEKDRVVSPILTTTREYGNWLETVFDQSICDMELYMRSKKAGGDVVLEKHPGTRIGAYFDKITPTKTEYKSWFILENSKAIDRIVKLQLAEKKDVIPISVNDVEGRRMLRLYTVQQVELYIRTKIDRNFSIKDYISTPKQVKVEDMNLIICPEIRQKKKKLF